MRKLCLAVAFIFLSPSLQAAPQYRITELNPVSGFENSYASSINDLGQVAGASSTHSFIQNNSYIKSQATIWTWNGTTIMSTAANAATNALAINNASHIVGFTAKNATPDGYLLTDNPHPINATLWSNNTPTTLSSLGGNQSVANNINDKDQIVGWSKTSESLQIATVWEHGTGTALSTPGQINSEAFAINDQGVIVGDIGGGGTAHNIRAVSWINNTLTYLNSTGSSQAFDINNGNQIVGWSQNNNSGQYATLWENGLETLLGVDGSTYSYAYAINNHGAIVGSYITEDTFDEYAVLWQNGNAVRLSSLLINGNGISLQTADDINNKGWILANGLNINGERRSFLLIPVPEPSSSTLLILGLVVGGTYYRKRQCKQ
jgi:probable HAF family extracellular repeat protein